MFNFVKQIAVKIIVINMAIKIFNSLPHELKSVGNFKVKKKNN
jgi:hypothetical protein